MASVAFVHSCQRTASGISGSPISSMLAFPPFFRASRIAESKRRLTYESVSQPREIQLVNVNLWMIFDEKKFAPKDVRVPTRVQQR